MTEPIVDRWSTRDFPVLRYIVPIMDANPQQNVYSGDIAAALGMDKEHVLAALHALATDALIDTYSQGGMQHITVTRISADARRIVGVWPNDDVAADRLIAAIGAMAERTDIPEQERSRWATVLSTLGGASRDFVVQVAASMLSGQLPH